MEEEVIQWLLKRWSSVLKELSGLTDTYIRFTIERDSDGLFRVTLQEEFSGIEDDDFILWATDEGERKAFLARLSPEDRESELRKNKRGYTNYSPIPYRAPMLVMNENSYGLLGSSRRFFMDSLWKKHRPVPFVEISYDVRENHKTHRRFEAIPLGDVIKIGKTVL